MFFEKENPIGKTLQNRYKIECLIGKGVISKVYLASDFKLHTMLAIKEIDYSCTSNLYTREQIYQDLIQYKLNHPNIAHVYDIIEDEESYKIYIVMEYIKGKSLGVMLKEKGRLSVEEVVYYTKQIASALSYMHSQRPPVIYNNVSPNNTIINDVDQVKIVDFDGKRKCHQMANVDTLILGIFYYMAPEQLGKCQTDERTDIYSLGMTMYHLVTGKIPDEYIKFSTTICQIDPSLPRGLEYIIDKCVQLNPNDRYQTCEELINDLNRYQELPPKKTIWTKLFGFKKK